MSFEALIFVVFYDFDKPLGHILSFQVNYSGLLVRRNNERHHVQESEYFSCYYGKHRIEAVDMLNYTKF